MNNYKITFSASAILISAFLVTSCSQEAGNSSNSGSETTVLSETPAVENNAAIAGSYVALSNDKVTVIKGEVFILDITANNFVISEGGSVTLHFNPALMQAINVSVDASVWDFVNKSGRINNTEGKVSDILFSSYQGVSGNAKIATVTFEAINKGAAEITLTESSVNPFASNGQKMDVAFKTTSVTVD